MHEASGYRRNSFLTLTYDEEHLPKDGSLIKSHHQKFMKRLRRRFPETKLKYYQCGEYGEENNRPHYHSCLFNMAFPDEILYSNNHGLPLYTSKILEDTWERGFAICGNLDYRSAEYVSGYILKKITGTQADDHYKRYDDRGNAYWLEPEYTTMSNGLGSNWFKTYHGDCFPSDDMPIPGVGIVRGIPRYYEQIMEDINPETMEKAKKIRAAFAAAHPELYTAEHLNSQYKIYKANQLRHRRDL